MGFHSKEHGALEPGVFGILYPVLLLPSGISEHLTDPQLEAILAHELSHARRRDNLAAAFHMLVEAVFWFHPLVWWLGARLVDERERACDEEVLRMGSDPQAYAEGILQVCEFYLQSPLACVSEVSGADLKKRIEEIMKRGIAQKLDLGKKLLLATVAMVAVAGLIIVGLLSAPQTRAQSPAAAGTHVEFDVASIRPCSSGSLPPGARSGSISASAGRLSMNCVTVKSFIIGAYVDFANGQRPGYASLKLLPVEGGPAWINSERYTINAETEGNASPEMMRGPMLQALLEDRFNLKIHRETREVPVYELTVAKSGLKPQRAEEGSCTPRDSTNPTRPLEPGQKPYCGQAQFVRKGPNFSAELRSMTLDEFSKWLRLDRLVVDKTGIKGRFDFHLEFASDETTPGLLPGGGDPNGAPGAARSDPEGPSIFTALQQQLGLKLVPAKGPGEFLVIDHVERPSKN